MTVALQGLCFDSTHPPRWRHVPFMIRPQFWSVRDNPVEGRHWENYENPCVGRFPPPRRGPRYRSHLGLHMAFDAIRHPSLLARSEALDAVRRPSSPSASRDRRPCLHDLASSLPSTSLVLWHKPTNPPSRWVHSLAQGWMPTVSPDLLPSTIATPVYLRITSQAQCISLECNTLPILTITHHSKDTSTLIPQSPPWWVHYQRYPSVIPKTENRTRKKKKEEENLIKWQKAKEKQEQVTWTSKDWSPKTRAMARRNWSKQHDSSRQRQG